MVSSCTAPANGWMDGCMDEYQFKLWALMSKATKSAQFITKVIIIQAFWFYFSMLSKQHWLPKAALITHQPRLLEVPAWPHSIAWQDWSWAQAQKGHHKMTLALPLYLSPCHWIGQSYGQHRNECQSPGSWSLKHSPQLADKQVTSTSGRQSKKVSELWVHYTWLSCPESCFL